MTLPDNPPPYTIKEPLVNTTIADAQQVFQNNFEQLFTGFNRNHTPIDDLTNPGNHEVIELVEMPQSESTLSQEIAIYSKKVEGQTDQLFMRYQGNGKEFQITEYQIYSIPKTAQQEAYFSFLPGKVIVYFGKALSGGKTTFDISVNPPPSVSISGVNLGGIGTAMPQPNVVLVAFADGFFRTIRLTAGDAMVDNYYLFFGNL